MANRDTSAWGPKAAYPPVSVRRDNRRTVDLVDADERLQLDDLVAQAVGLCVGHLSGLCHGLQSSLQPPAGVLGLDEP